MELSFQEKSLNYLAETVCDGIVQELTEEMLIPESMPPISRIVDCFGTVLVQNKTVENGSVAVTGRILAGVLYVPEGEKELMQTEVLLPFTVSKKMTTDGNAALFYWGWIRSIDARFINPRKLLVRASLGSELTLLTPDRLILRSLQGPPRELACKTVTYPLRLPVAAAEKELQIADEVLLPEQAGGADKLLKWTCGAEIDDTRVVGDKAVWKGRVRLRTLYQSEDGRLETWSGTLPFSQYVQLDREPEDGTMTVQPIFRSAELDTDGQPDSRRLLVNLTLTMQVLVRGIVPLTVTEDAYHLKGSFRPTFRSISLTPYLDELRQEVSSTVRLPAEAERLLDWTVCRDRPVSDKAGEENGLNAELFVNLVYYDAERALRSKSLRSVVRIPIGETDGGCDCGGSLCPNADESLHGGELQLPMTAELRFRRKTVYEDLTGGTLETCDSGEQPSLVIRRGSGALWELAKADGSTVEAIRAANGLETDLLSEERLLLIPTGLAALNGKEEST